MTNFVVYDIRGWYFVGWEDVGVPVYASHVERAHPFRYREVAEGVAAHCASLNPHHRFRVIEMEAPRIPEERVPAQKASTPRTVRDLELTANEYQKLAMRTCSIPYENKKDMLVHATTGLASEAGEFAGLLQKIYQGHEYDKEHAIKELGDCCWMIAEAAVALDVTLEQVMRTNIDKLKARFPDGFDPEKSLHRREGDV